MKSNNGFTLLELLVAIGIVAISSAFIIPNYMSWRDDSKVKGAAASLRADFERAKRRAIHENANVRVEFAVDERSYTVHVDTNSNNAQDAGEEVITQVFVPPGVTLVNNFAGDDMSFSSRGIPAAGLGDAGTAVMTSPGGRQYSVIVSRFGRIRTQ